jgi:hypothetical protein
MVKSFTRFWIVALLVAWGFDFLFWKKPAGISFPLFLTILVSGGLVLGALEKRYPAIPSLILLLPLGFFAVMSFWRLEPFTTLINVLMSMIFLAIMTMSYLGGHWLHYGWVDYAKRLFDLSLSALIKPIQAWQSRARRIASPNDQTPNRKIRNLIPVLRGLLIALPILLILGTLLASADPIFGQGIQGFLELLNIKILPEYIFRLVYILVLAYFLLGIYLYGLTSSGDETLYGLVKPIVPRFMGFTEAAIVLGSVNLLFAAFVVVQFRYFFGGQGNIHLDGFTYSEYARRGFTELVLVAFITLLLFLALSTVAKRLSHGQRLGFSAMGVGLTILIGVILLSAYQRLLLYETAYGFSRLRTYTHVFIIWLGILLLILMLLELFSRLRLFALASLLVAVGFGISLNLMPVDGFIARQNILQAQNGDELDSPYLVSLSFDAAPTLWQMYADPKLNASIREQIGGVLACQAALKPPTDLPWQGFNLSSYQAERLFQAHQSELYGYNAHLDNYGNWVVMVNSKLQNCQPAP